MKEEERKGRKRRGTAYMQEGKEREKKERRENGCIYLFPLFLSLSPSLSLRTADTFLRIILSYRISYHYHDRPRRIKDSRDE